MVLTDKQHTELKALHKEMKKLGKTKEAYRVNAILLSHDGMSYEAIGKVLLLDTSTVKRYVKDYYRKGSIDFKHKGSESFLNPEQTKELVNHLEEYTYPDVISIVGHVSHKYSISYTVSGMNKWLKANGFSYKHFSEVPHKCDKEMQEEFVTDYEKFKEGLTDNDVVLFADGVHPTMQTKKAKGWIKQGVTKVIETTGSRTRANIFGAVDIYNHDTIFKEYKTINSESVEDFLREIYKSYDKTGKKVHLFVDRASYNTTESLHNVAKELNIELYHIPPYSPNLNPIERLWKYMNKKVRNNIYFEKAKEFKSKIMEFLQETVPKLKHELKTLINDNFQLFSKGAK